MLDEFQVPSSERPGSFVQHYVLVMGRREEYADDERRVRALASEERDDETLMSWDRLIEMRNPSAAKFGCIHLSRASGRYEIISGLDASTAGSLQPGSQEIAPEDAHVAGLRYKPRRRNR
jgi:hypothetical protein